MINDNSVLRFIKIKESWIDFALKFKKLPKIKLEQFFI